MRGNYEYVRDSQLLKKNRPKNTGKLSLNLYKRGKYYHGWAPPRTDGLRQDDREWTKEGNKLWRDNTDKNLIKLPVITQYKKGYSQYKHIKNTGGEINSTHTGFTFKSSEACSNCIYDSFSNKNKRKLSYFRCAGHNVVKRRPKVNKKHNPKKKHKRKPITSCERLIIMFNQKYKCNHCKNMLNPDTTDIDHKVELCDGGINDILNLQALCCNCHRKKTAISRRNRNGDII